MTSLKNDMLLEKGNWEENLYERLSQLIKENSNLNAKTNNHQKPYAVFDWDNTSIINDIGNATFTYQIMNLAFKMTPEVFDRVIRTNVPNKVFSSECNNNDGKTITIDKIAKDLLSDYTILFNTYEGMKGNKPLEEVKQFDEYKDFCAKLRYLYIAIGRSFDRGVSPLWVTYFYAGMTSEEVQKLSEKAIDYALHDKLVYEKWTSPKSLSGNAGQVSVTFKRGIRSVKEMQNLYQILMQNGIDVYICSASYHDVILEYATNKKYGYNLPKSHIFGMRLLKDETGMILPEFDMTYVQTQGEGKTSTIKNLIAVNHNNMDPILVAGDSDGDYSMLKDFKQMKVGIIFNLLHSSNTDIGRLAVEAMATYGKKDEIYFLQGRDENKGILLKGRETIKLEQGKCELLVK